MSEPGSKQPPSQLTDSGWFWVLLFSAAALVFLLVITPQYRPRQRRLEMQYRAREEILRRRAEGEPLARPAGEEGEAAPPTENELIISLWPLGLLFGGAFVLSATMLWRVRRREQFAEPNPRGDS